MTVCIYGICWKGLFGHVICILHAVNELYKLYLYLYEISLILTRVSKTWIEHNFFFFDV